MTVFGYIRTGSLVPVAFSQDTPAGSRENTGFWSGMPDQV